MNDPGNMLIQNSLKTIFKMCEHFIVNFKLIVAIFKNGEEKNH